MGCVYDLAHRCGPHQELLPADCCGCVTGYIANDLGCVALVCAEHEQISGNECVCEADFARPSPDQPCAPIPMGLGTACSDTMPCADPAYSECHSTLGKGDYCTTTGCTQVASLRSICAQGITRGTRRWVAL